MSVINTTSASATALTLTGDTGLTLDFQVDGVLKGQVTTTGVKSLGSPVWTSGNDGIGSGLDPDTTTAGGTIYTQYISIGANYQMVAMPVGGLYYISYNNADAISHTLALPVGGTYFYSGFNSTGLVGSGNVAGGTTITAITTTPIVIFVRRTT